MECGGNDGLEVQIKPSHRTKDKSTDLAMFLYILDSHAYDLS